MKTLILTLFTVVCFALTTPIDTVGLDKQTKETVDKIIKLTEKIEQCKLEITQARETKIKDQKEILAEKDKHDKILKEIKAYIGSHQKEFKGSKKVISAKIDGLIAVKNQEYNVDIPPQKTMYEEKPRTWFGRLFNKDSIKRTPYLYLSDSTRIYINKK